MGNTDQLDVSLNSALDGVLSELDGENNMRSELDEALSGFSAKDSAVLKLLPSREQQLNWAKTLKQDRLRIMMDSVDKDLSACYKQGRRNVHIMH